MTHHSSLTSVTQDILDYLVEVDDVHLAVDVYVGERTVQLLALQDVVKHLVNIVDVNRAVAIRIGRNGRLIQFAFVDGIEVTPLCGALVALR